MEGKISTFSHSEPKENFTIMVASTRDLRSRAYSLAYQTYLQKGYTPVSSTKWLENKRDADPSTLTLLLQDSEGEDAGTITLNFDEEGDLPCEELFPEEVLELKSANCRLAEVTRICISNKYRMSRELLIKMMNLVYIYTYIVRGYSHFVIEVNPRHRFFYEKLLGYERHGKQKKCPRVSDAPAIFMSIDLSWAERVIGKKIPQEDRCIYKNFYAKGEETLMAEYLEKGHRPMGEDEKIHFGLKKIEKRTESKFV